MSERLTTMKKNHAMILYFRNPLRICPLNSTGLISGREKSVSSRILMWRDSLAGQ